MRLRDALTAATVRRTLERDAATTAAQLRRGTESNPGRLARHLQSVRIALLRLRRHDYGKCAACGQRISSVRLRLLPATGTCAKCQKTLDTKITR
jgi:RNA polymerase-binding transcription factor DksA